MSVLPVATISPDKHMCGKQGEVSFNQVNDGLIWCRQCGRIWDLTEHGWKPDPRPPMTAEQRAAMNKARYAKRH